MILRQLELTKNGLGLSYSQRPHNLKIRKVEKKEDAHKQARLDFHYRSTGKLIEEGNSWLSTSSRTLENLRYAGECFDKALSNARQSNDPKTFLQAYRGLLYVELEKTHLHGVVHNTHIKLAEDYCEKANKAARDSSRLGDLSKVQFDRACITERKACLAQRRSRASAPSLSKLWNQAFEEFNRIANGLGKIENLTIDMVDLRIRALHGAGRMAAKLQGTALASQRISTIPEDSSAKDRGLCGESLVPVSDPFSFYREALGIMETFRLEASLSESNAAELKSLTQAEEEIRSSLQSKSS
jgi:hypothetical protein